MGNKKTMVPVGQMDLSTVKYEPQVIQAPHLTGNVFRFFLKLLESPIIGPLLLSHLKKENKMIEMLRCTVIPEPPMFVPEYPPQGPESCVVPLEEDGKPEGRVELALKTLPQYDPATYLNVDSTAPFRHWRIRDYAHAYRSKLITPSVVAEHVISAIEESRKSEPHQPLLISFDAAEVREQAAGSTQRFEEGNPISILDGIFIAIKDDIDCYPHPTNGGTTWLHKVRSVKRDAVCVSRLRSCGAIFVGKANMHELGMGTTGNNSNYGTVRNPYAPDRYTGGSSSGPAAIVASGICCAAVGSDGGGSVRIPSSLCGVVGLKTTHGRTDMGGYMTFRIDTKCVVSIGLRIIVLTIRYAAMLGSSIADRISVRPGPPCLPDLSSHEGIAALGSMRLGKFTAWFNDVQSTDVSDKCEDALNLLSRTHGCEVVEIVIPELDEMRNSHIVSIGADFQSSLAADIEDGKGKLLTYDSRTNVALFQTFSAADFVTSQRLRRRSMHHYLEAFKKVDVIVTPTTGMTAPVIPPSALKYGETDIKVTAYLMRFVVGPNLLGFPAISVPVGYDKKGLPIGLQLIGRPWAEATILRLAFAIEQLFAESKKKPVLFHNVLKPN
ncbi:Fatty acid amide hydrolase [Linum perenne]